MTGSIGKIIRVLAIQAKRRCGAAARDAVQRAAHARCLRGGNVGERNSGIWAGGDALVAVERVSTLAGRTGRVISAVEAVCHAGSAVRLTRVKSTRA